MASGSTCEDGHFNIEVVIKDFLADSTTGSLELPHMTTGQRKQVKKAVDLQPELKCESYGFGAERKLHLFKKSWDKQQDGLEVPAARPELSPIKEGSDSRSPARDASAKVESPMRVEGSDLLTEANLNVPSGLDSFQVRNTFIHIHPEAMDERMVQSMPHGMFSQIMVEETSHEAVVEAVVEDAVPETALAVAPSWQVPDYLAGFVRDFQFMPGMHVVVDGLVKLPAFNGLSGVIQSFEEETGRYSVLLASPTLPNGQQLAKVKAQNLRTHLFPPPPPQYPAPTVLVDDPSAEMYVPSTPEGAIPFGLTTLVSCC